MMKMHNKHFRLTVIAGLFVYGNLVTASEIGDLTTFSSGTAAKAAEVNENFNSVKTAVNDNHTRLSTSETSIEANSTRISDAESALSDNNTRLTAAEATLVSNSDRISLAEAAINDTQRKISGTCQVGSAIRTINADGTVICDPNRSAGSVIISNFSMVPTTSGCTANHRIDNTYLSGNRTTCFMAAPINLPDNISLLSISCAVTDITTESSFDVMVIKEDLLTGDNGLVVASTNPSVTSGRQTLFGTFSADVITNNGEVAYRLLVRSDLEQTVPMDSILDNLQFHGCTLAYNPVSN